MMYIICIPYLNTTAYGNVFKNLGEESLSSAAVTLYACKQCVYGGPTQVQWPGKVKGNSPN